MRSRRIAALPVLSRRILIICHEAGVPNPQKVTPDKMCTHLRHLYFDSVTTMLDPKLVKAALQGALPQGVSARRFLDAPVDWHDQWRAVGLGRPV